jgi:O-antigen/teichoic acid export membrane protein
MAQLGLGGYKGLPSTAPIPLMLWRHSASYLLARGLPGLLSLAAIAVYTRLLGAEEYGSYALVIAGVGLTNKLFFEWLRLSLLRFRPGFTDRLDVFEATIAAAFFALMGATAVLGGIALLAGSELVPRSLLVAGIALLWIQALFDLEIERARSELQPKRYGLMAFGRAALALTLGVLLVTEGLGALGLLVGLIAAMLIVLGKPLGERLEGLRLGAGDWDLMAQLCRYGGPLAVTAALGYLINSSDRFIIGWLLDSAAVGRYAVAYDLTSFSIGLVLMIVNLAAYPLVIHALQEHGAEHARQQLVANLTALLAVGVPAAVGLALLAKPIAGVLLGPDFQDDAATLIPLIAVAAMLRDLKAYYLDLAFHLGRNTVLQMCVTVVAFVLNVVLNLWWIPVFGIVGSAYAMIVAYAVALVLSAIAGRSVFRLPGLNGDGLKVVLAACGMAIALWQVNDLTGPVALAGQVLGGVGVYGLLVLALDVAGVRGRALASISGLRRGLASK